MADHSFQHIVSTRAVAAFTLLYVTVLSITCYLKYATFQYADFDLAVHTQSIHNLLRGSFDCSILGVPYPGNHMAVILALIAPLYALLPSPVTLLLIQTIILSSGAAAVFLYAKKHLAYPYPAVIASAYLLYPPLAFMNLYEFHPVALASAFLLYAMLAYDRRSPRLYALFLLLAMACQENISLIVIMLGIKAAVDRRKLSWIVPPLAAGGIWFIACIFWIMPHFNPGIIRFDAIYGHFGNSLTDVVRHIILHPVDTLAYALTLPNLLYLSSLLLPLALTPLLSPLAFLPALPVLAQRLLSSRGSETTILFHYQAELIPFIFVAAIHGLARLNKAGRISWQKIAVICIAILTMLSVCLSRLPLMLQHTAKAARQNIRLTHLRTKLTSSIRSDAGAAATFRYLSHLANRSNLHSVHHIYTGYYTLSGTKYPLPHDIDIVLIDTDDPLTFGSAGFYTDSGSLHIDQMLQANSMRPILNAAPLTVFTRSGKIMPIFKNPENIQEISSE